MYYYCVCTVHAYVLVTSRWHGAVVECVCEGYTAMVMPMACIHPLRIKMNARTFPKMPHLITAKMKFIRANRIDAFTASQRHTTHWRCAEENDIWRKSVVKVQIPKVRTTHRRRCGIPDEENARHFPSQRHTQCRLTWIQVDYPMCLVHVRLHRLFRLGSNLLLCSHRLAVWGVLSFSVNETETEMK